MTATITPVDYQGLVREFHEAFGHPVADRPTLVAHELAALRYRLIVEEVDEYLEASALDDLTGIADALGDILYVTHGASLVHGIDLGPVFSEIHRSNMTKLGADGKPVYRSDGKVLKGPNYETPQLEAIVLAQQESGTWA